MNTHPKIVAVEVFKCINRNNYSLQLKPQIVLQIEVWA